MTESSSGSIVLSSDEDEGVFHRRLDYSPDMFQMSPNCTLSSRSPPRNQSTVSLETITTSDDDAVERVDSLDHPTPYSQIDGVIEISDTEENQEIVEIDDDDVQPPIEKPKTRTRKKKASINLKELEVALSKIALNDTNSKKERLSFLSSLSEKTFDLPVHPEAHFYKANFKHLKEKLSAVLFKMFNTQVFHCGLATDMKIEWSGRLTSTAGKTFLIRRRTGAHESSILLSSKVLTTAETLRDTLIHEMCHAAAWTIDKYPNANHGPVWVKWTELARKRFPELPPIGRTHSYSLEYKYNWECQLCGYKFGRHRNTVDIIRHRCPFCRGILAQV